MVTIDRPQPRAVQTVHIKQEKLAKGEALQWCVGRIVK